jgi:hypothetical protein
MGTPVDLTRSREDDGVEARPSKEHSDRAKGGYDILAASHHQTAEDDDPRALLAEVKREVDKAPSSTGRACRTAELPATLLGQGARPPRKPHDGRSASGRHL